MLLAMNASLSIIDILDWITFNAYQNYSKHVLFKNLFQFNCEFNRYMYSSYSNMRKWKGNNTLTHATLLFLWLHFLSKVNQRTKINQRQLFVSLLMLVHKNIQFTENKLTLQTLKLKLKLETFYSSNELKTSS